jgi:hypothetical protein
MESFEMIEKREEKMSDRIQGYMTTGLSYVEAERVMYEVDRTHAQMVRAQCMVRCCSCWG